VHACTRCTLLADVPVLAPVHASCLDGIQGMHWLDSDTQWLMKINAMWNESRKVLSLYRQRVVLSETSLTDCFSVWRQLSGARASCIQCCVHRQDRNSVSSTHSCLCQLVVSCPSLNCNALSAIASIRHLLCSSISLSYLSHVVSTFVNRSMRRTV